MDTGENLHTGNLSSDFKPSANNAKLSQSLPAPKELTKRGASSRSRICMQIEGPCRVAAVAAALAAAAPSTAFCREGVVGSIL